MIPKATVCLLLTHFLELILHINAKIPAIVVFGDSSVDSGNNNYIPTVLKSNFEPYGRDFYGRKPTGRFCNGRLPTDIISEAFGLKQSIPAFLDPTYNISHFATGVCFASAGTGYDNVTSSVLSVIPLWKEVEYFKEYQKQLRSYLGNEKADEVIGEALYLISIGTNDFLENYYTIPVRSSQYNVGAYQDFLVAIAKDLVTELYQLGARKLSLGGLPPMGCLPLERTTNLLFGGGCIEKYNDVAKEFNEKLAGLVQELNQELKGARVVFSNPYYILLGMIKKPSSFGFESAGVACCATGLYEMSYLCNKNNPCSCKDANKYVFWDAFHPTEKTNGVAARHLIQTTLAEFFYDT
ncbi:GDSL esterase/lipase-like protein [Drosera capensis]